MFVDPLTGRLVEGELRADEKGLADMRQEVEARPWLQKVSVRGNKLASLRPLAKLRDLVWLDASRNQLVEALDFAAARCGPAAERSHDDHHSGPDDEARAWPQGAGWTGSNLQVALLAHNSISRLEHARAHVHLRVLDLSHNNVATICDLGPLRHLEELDLSRNCLDTLNGLGSLEHLRVLRVDHNYLRNLRACSRLPRLQELTAVDNELTHLEGLDMCSGLQVLRVAQNNLAQIALVAPLEHLRMLGTLEMCDNPCASKEFYRQRVLFRLQQLDFLDGEEATAAQKVRARCLFGGDLDQRADTFSQFYPGQEFLCEAQPFADEEVCELEQTTEAAIGLTIDVMRQAAAACTAQLLPGRMAALVVEEAICEGLAAAMASSCAASAR